MIHIDSSRRENFRAKAFLALGSFLGAAGLSAGSAWATSVGPTETVLYSFCQQTNCADGQFPAAGLIATSQGGLYGTTIHGGNANAGVAFFVSITGGSGILHAFQNSSMDGGEPVAPLFMDKSGNFFGTNFEGGPNLAGTVFERSASGAYRLRHAFSVGDGSDPLAGVIADGAGKLYGTTNNGGANNFGTMFVLTPSGNLKTLYTFCNLSCPDGANPVAGLIGDANGNLYGTTESGGGVSDACNAGCGVVFKIHADGTGYTVLHNFTGGTSDGANPLVGLSADASGNLYGTTSFAGANNNGTVFKLSPNGSSYTYAVLYNFCSLASCADGSSPDGGVILDAAGNLYGATEFGGGTGCGGFGCGVVFSLTPSGAETVLYSFGSVTANGIALDGSGPLGNLVALGNGNLYGATNTGGTMNDGTVYQLTNTGFVP